jgi:hypothetical protein
VSILSLGLAAATDLCSLSSQVTVYRMICSNTVEEKIVKRASQKSTVQQLVMTGQQAQADVFQPEEVMSLLLDDAELEQQMKAQAAKQPVSGVSLLFWPHGVDQLLGGCCC